MHIIYDELTKELSHMFSSEIHSELILKIIENKHSINELTSWLNQKYRDNNTKNVYSVTPTIMRRYCKHIKRELRDIKSINFIYPLSNFTIAKHFNDLATLVELHVTKIITDEHIWEIEDKVFETECKISDNTIRSQLTEKIEMSEQSHSPLSWL